MTEEAKVPEEEIKKSKEFIDTHGEYSKKVLNKFIIMWFIGAFYGMFITTYELLHGMEVHIEAWYVYIGGPVTGGIITYLIKSMKEKINLALKCQGIDRFNNSYVNYDDDYEDGGNNTDYGSI